MLASQLTTQKSAAASLRNSVEDRGWTLAPRQSGHCRVEQLHRLRAAQSNQLSLKHSPNPPQRGIGTQQGRPNEDTGLDDTIAGASAGSFSWDFGSIPTLPPDGADIMSGSSSGIMSQPLVLQLVGQRHDSWSDREAPDRSGRTMRASVNSQPIGLNPAAVPRLQAQLRVWASDDPLEREADRLADTVMRMQEPSEPRICPECEDEHRNEAGTVRRACIASGGPPVSRRQEFGESAPTATPRRS
jgi:hypothetical protein